MITMDERQGTSLLTPEQVAKRLNVKERKVMDMLRRKILPGIKIEKDWRVDSADLERYIEQQKRSRG
jgi:excisionase family DNA binding protein